MTHSVSAQSQEQSILDVQFTYLMIRALGLDPVPLPISADKTTRVRMDRDFPSA